MGPWKRRQSSRGPCGSGRHPLCPAGLSPGLARSLSSRALQPARRVKRHQRLNNVKTVSFKPFPELPSSRQSPFLHLLKPETGKMARIHLFSYSNIWSVSKSCCDAPSPPGHPRTQPPCCSQSWRLPALWPFGTLVPPLPGSHSDLSKTEVSHAALCLQHSNGFCWNLG